jgi:hypothetical protein
MFHMCWALSDGSSKLIPIDEQPNHQIVHLFRLGKAKGATHESLNPGPEIDVLALDFLRILLAHVVLLGIDMPLVGSPSVRVKLRDAKGLQELLQLEEDGVFASSEHIRQHLPGVMIYGVPEPSRMRFRLHKTPHFVELRAEPTTHLQLIRAPDFYLNLLGMHGRQHVMIHRLQLRLFFFSSLMTVVGLTCSTRAVSRMPLAFIAMSTICCLIAAE